MDGWMHSIPTTGLRIWQNGAPQPTTGGPFESEARIRGVDDVYRWFLTKGVPLRDESGNIVRWYGTNIDIDQRKRAESFLAGEKRLLEMIATGAELKEILNVLCLSVEEYRKGTLASVLLVNPMVFTSTPSPDQVFPENGYNKWKSCQSGRVPDRAVRRHIGDRQS
jgi:hypothetical protein